MTRRGPKRARPSSRPRPPRRRTGEVLAAVRPIAQRLSAERDLFLWDVEFTREAGRETLRVAIDREGGIGSDEITGFSESLSRELDAMGAVPGDTRYILEVTTPGAERKLRTPEQFATCRGRQARLTFRDGRPPLEGVIADADETSVRVEGEGGPVVVAFDEVSQARLNAPGV